MWVEKNPRSSVCFIKEEKDREEILRIYSNLLYLKIWGWDSSEVMGQEETEAWRLAPKALKRQLQKDVMCSARMRSIFSGLSSQYIYPTQLFSLCRMSQLQTIAVTPRLITRGGRGTSHHSATERKGIHSPTDRTGYSLAPLGNWRALY